MRVAERLFQGALLGALLGASHAIAECSTLWWYGVALTPLDVALLLATYATIAAAAGAAFGTALALASRRVSDTDVASRRALLLVLVMGYAAVAWRYHREAAHTPANVALALIVAGFLVGLAWIRAAGSAIGLLVGALALAFFTSTTGLLVAEAEAITPDRRNVAYLQAMSPFAAMLLALFLVRRSAGHRRPELLAAGAALVLGALLVPAWRLSPPPPPSLHVHRTPPAERAAEPRHFPDVFLIVLDTVRADHLELFGYERATMPRLADVARREFQVKAVTMSTSSSSLPAHGSMFTGLYSYRHGGHKPFFADPDPPSYAYFMRDDVPTLAARLSTIGFRTIGISGNYGVLSSYGLGRGFEEYDVAPGVGDLAARLTWLRALHVMGRSPSGVLRRLLTPATERGLMVLSRFEPPDRRADEITDRAKHWLDDHPREHVFMFLNYVDAHDPYVPPPEFEERFAKRPIGVEWIGFPEETAKAIERGEGTLPPAELAYLEGLYDAELAFVDHHLARFFDELRRLGRYEGSLILIVSDHGEEFLEHGNLRHSSSVLGPQIDVPLLLKMPSGWPEPPQSASRMQFVDFYPTVLTLLGQRIETEVQGSYFAEGREHQFAEGFCHRPHIERLCREQVAIRRGDLKYVHSLSQSRPEGWIEVYDLVSDPGEKSPLESPPAEFVAKAQTMIVQRKQATYLPRRTSVQDSARLLDRLGQLGYVDDAPTNPN